MTGIVFNGRLHEEHSDEVIGVFLNTLPLRIAVHDETLISVARKIFEYEEMVTPNGRYPFSRMQQDIGGALVLDSYVNFMDFHRDWNDSSKEGIRIKDAIGIAYTNFPLAVNFLINPIQGQLQLWLDCDVTLLGSSFCERLVGYYQKALSATAYEPEQKIEKLDLLSQYELATIATANQTQTYYDEAKTLNDFIDEQIQLRPNEIAVVHQWSELSYIDLAIRVNQLAHYLQHLGVDKGKVVGIYLDRNLDLVISILAVLKVGAVYLPLDPHYPLNRLHFIAEDANLYCLITTHHVGFHILKSVKQLQLEQDRAKIAAQPHTPIVVEPINMEDVAYIIYTSGSTGSPKGVVVTHRNLANFILGMNQQIGCTDKDVVLAVTSISFDISILELLWPLTQGAKIVIAGAKLIKNLLPQEIPIHSPLDFSLFFFGAVSTNQELAEGYQLVLDAARYADQHGFKAVWTPERHFHEFGGLYPNPSVLTAALSTITERVELRAGSVVAPLHDMIRIAEEWSLVDNLSKGRVGLAFASGWNANDFVLAPSAYLQRKERLSGQIAEFKKLWSGESIERINGCGESIKVKIFPSPLQKDPQIWLTSAGAIETFESAGILGVNILTHLLGQDVGELAEKIRTYRAAWSKSGHAGRGKVTVMLHTFVMDLDEEAKREARDPFREYLRVSTGLLKMLSASMGLKFDEDLSHKDLESILDLAVERYFERSGLFGSPSTLLETLQKLSAISVDEVACLIDFGISATKVLQSLPFLNQLQQNHKYEIAELQHSFVDLCQRHQVTLLQGTPSFLNAIVAEKAAVDSMQHIRTLLVGGESFPTGLAERLISALPNARIFNMYGPTETTIWSAVHLLDIKKDIHASIIPIGHPIANTEIMVLDEQQRVLPIGVIGELWIGGDGVSIGYLGSPKLTKERFLSHPSGHGYMYRTGDLARRRDDGILEILGRSDRQIKILGHRIELDEVESVLSRQEQVESVAVVPVSRQNQSLELVAYVVPGDRLINLELMEAHIQNWADIWDKTYDLPIMQHKNTEHDFSGWMSSYTNEPIPSNEMQEWLKYTKDRILRLNPRHIIDVGVGVGLIQAALMPYITSYFGLDISEEALNRLKVKAIPLLDNTKTLELIHGNAEHLAKLPDGRGDTVVINSVIQYFPNANYLLATVIEAMRIVGSNGALFIGDVRNYELLEAFHASVQFYRAPVLMTAAELMVTINQQIAAERELCISPKFFQNMTSKWSTPSQVIIELKGGAAVNELTCFRYDITVLGEERIIEEDATMYISWDAFSEKTLSMHKSSNERIRITKIPNRRLVRPLKLLQLLKIAAGNTSVWELERQLWDVDEFSAVEPESLVELGQSYGYDVSLLMSAESSQFDVFDALFEPLRS